MARPCRSALLLTIGLGVALVSSACVTINVGPASVAGPTTALSSALPTSAPSAINCATGLRYLVEQMSMENTLPSLPTRTRLPTPRGSSSL